MKAVLAFLCKKFKIRKDGLFNATGGGIDCLHFHQLPAEHWLAIAVDVDYDPITESGEHIIKIRVINSDGKDKMPPIILNVNFPQSQWSFDISGDLTPVFEEYGSHSVEVTIDGHNIASLPLNVVQETQ